MFTYDPVNPATERGELFLPPNPLRVHPLIKPAQKAMQIPIIIM